MYIAGYMLVDCVLNICSGSSPGATGCVKFLCVKLLLEMTFGGGFSVLNFVDRGAWRATGGLHGGLHGVSKSGP